MSPGDRPNPSAGVRRPVRVAIVAVGVAVAAWLISEALSGIDFAEIGDALARLTAVDATVLVAGLVVRQAVGGVPLTRFVPGLTVARAVQSDLGAGFLATVAPPPSDLVLRHAMFREWDVDTTAGFAGYTLRTVLFYVARFGVPILGAVGLQLVADVSIGVAVTALVSALIAAGVVAVVIAVTRGDHAAAAIGRAAGRVAHRARPSIDPRRWEQYLVDLRGQVAARLRSQWPAATLASVGFILAEGVLLLVAARAIGLPADLLPAAALVGAFLAAYPLTALPFFGLGFLEAAVFAILALTHGDALTPALLTAFVVWRVMTLLLPLVLGGLVVVLWRRGRPVADTQAGQPPG